MTQPVIYPPADEESQMQTPRSPARKGREVRPHSCRSDGEGGRGREGLREGKGRWEEDRGWVEGRVREEGEGLGRGKGGRWGGCRREVYEQTRIE